MARALRDARPATVLLIAWAIPLIYAYPGQMTKELLAFLGEIRADPSGATPATPFATLWRTSEWLIGGQFGLLLLQSSSLLAGLYLLARGRLPARPAAWLAAAVFVFPPVMLPAAVIGPGAIVVGFSTLGLGALLSRRRLHRALGLAPLVVAVALSPSAAAAILPAVVLLAWWRPARSWRQRYGLALLAWLAVTGAGLATRAALTDAPAPAPAVARASGASGASDDAHPHSQLQVIRDLLLHPANEVQPRYAKRGQQITLGIFNRWSGLQRHWTKGLLELAAYTPLFAPWLFVAGLLLLLPWARRDRGLLAVAGGGALHTLALLATAATTEHAQWHFLLVSTSLLAALWLARAQLAPATAITDADAPDVPDEPDEPNEPNEHDAQAAPARSPRQLLAAAGRRARAISPVTILIIGWCGLFLYAYPGYMSYDSVRQLVEARSGVFSDAHPPVMAALWRIVDWIVAGSFGMYLVQTITFLIGANLIARRFTSARVAAICAVLVLWLPAVACVMAVIWKDSLMAALLLLGCGLLLSPRRGVRLGGLLALAFATSVRHNALTITLPLVVLMFVWDPALRGWRRYAISIVAWLAVTYSARVATNALADTHEDLWHDALALYEITGTLWYMPPTSDAEMRELLAGARVRPTEQLQLRARPEPSEVYLASVVAAAHNFFEPPTTPEHRAAIAQAWKNVVLGHPLAFLRYRWHASLQILQLAGPRGFPIYLWFSDVQDPVGSAVRIQHNGIPSRVQGWLQQRMVEVCSSFALLVYLYFFLSLALLPFCVRQPFLLTLVLSGLSGEAALLLFFPSPDTRYSVWMVITSVLTLCLLIARRLDRDRAVPLPQVPRDLHG